MFLAIIVLGMYYNHLEYFALLESWSNIPFCCAYLLFTITTRNLFEYVVIYYMYLDFHEINNHQSKVWRGGIICYQFGFAGAWVSFILFWVFFKK